MKSKREDWKSFVDLVFGVIKDIVPNVVRGDVTEPEMVGFRKSVAELEGLLATYAQQGKCPSTEAYESFKQIIMAAQNVVGCSPGGTFADEEGKNLAFLRADSSGKIYGLFPLESFKGEPVHLFNPVQGGQKYFVPTQNKSFQLDQQRGKEKILLPGIPGTGQRT